MKSESERKKIERGTLEWNQKEIYISSKVVLCEFLFLKVKFLLIAFTVLSVSVHSYFF